MQAGIANDEGVIPGQDRFSVGATERHRAGIARGGVAEGVLGSDREVMRNAGRGRSWISADDQGTGGGRVDRDAVVCFFGGRRGVGGGDRLDSGRFQGGAEGMRPAIAG